MSHEKSVVARDEINPFNAVYKTSFKFLEFHNKYFNIFNEKNQEFKRRFVKSYIVYRRDIKLPRCKTIVRDKIAALQNNRRKIKSPRYKTNDRQESRTSDKTT